MIPYGYKPRASGRTLVFHPTPVVWDVARRRALLTNLGLAWHTEQWYVSVFTRRKSAGYPFGETARGLLAHISKGEKGARACPSICTCVRMKTSANLTTKGRVSGRPHTIEIWFVLNKLTLSTLSGGLDQADWVQNILQQANVKVKIKDQVFPWQGRVVKDTEEATLVRL